MQSDSSKLGGRIGNYASNLNLIQNFCVLHRAKLVEIRSEYFGSETCEHANVRKRS
jgi:hypothetical protein